MSPVDFNHTQFLARVRLHGLTKLSNGAPFPIDLERHITFPMPADHRYTGKHDKDLAARILSPTHSIEARVCFDRQDGQEHAERDELGGALGFGRSGIVYPLEILSVKRTASGATAEADEALEISTLPPLCIKLARPGYARYLAREAWFYEQLDANNLTRLITPRCYGVFHTSDIPDDLRIDIPKNRYYEHTFTPIETGTEFKLYTIPMKEECYDFETNTLGIAARFMDDEKESYTNSEWRLFRETPEVSTMTVLLMDMLGPRLSLNEFENDWDGEINDICDHLIPFDIINDDLRLPNVLRVPPHLQVPCPMHPDAVPGHKWNLIDWEMARLTCAAVGRVAAWQQRHSIRNDYHSLGGDESRPFLSRPLAARWHQSPLGS